MSSELNIQAAPIAEQLASASLWDGLFSADASVFSKTWLSLTLEQLGGVKVGLVFGIPISGLQLQLLASTPSSIDVSQYRAILEAVLENPVADIHHLNGDSKVPVLCYPIAVGETVEALVLIEPGAVAGTELRQVMRKLQWAVGQLESFFIRRVLHSQEARTTRIVSSLELALTALDQDTLLGAAQALCTEIAVRLEAERVSLGLVEGKHCKVLAMSHTAQFAAESNYSRLLAAAMDEAIDQNNLVLLPNNLGRDSAPVTWVNRELQSASDAAGLCTVPFQHGEDFAGAIVIELRDASALDAGAMAVIEVSTAMMAPVLRLYQINERSIAKRAKLALDTQLGKLIGPRYVVFKAISSILLLSLIFSFLYKGEFRVTADATLEGRELRAAVTPFDGYIDEALRRAGDVVEAGAVLAVLDDGEIVLELNKWRAKQQQNLRRLREAKAEQNNADVRVVQAQLDEASAEIELLESKVEKTRILAPFAGYIVSGDLSESLGAPVERGEVLFELAPLEEFRVIARVDERDIKYLQVGQPGQLSLKGGPEDTLDIEVTRITPVADVRDGINAFEIEAALLNETDIPGLLPGMEGVVKVSVGQEPIIWIWTHRLLEWLRMWLWSWWP